ncbi:m-hydroxybenzyl alcohol hydroxylase [Delitschia confertaspora ATCC 74209]|uniref:M-hydroxybenzyl alcohol hydroxylase n=1 Tax=Delitschia confertaspora ATCC 74209 TaxID=1513339 RepID=A0A9P4MWN8_9PLEO|nr:m-hydroxybenzyl alcohol hydroxylase [Delitschia confertaspora ATCC 74209]
MSEFILFGTLFKAGSVVLLAGVSTLLFMLWSLLNVGRREKNLPPGPPTVPIWGNELQIPASDGHFQMTKWAKQYGGIFSLKRYRNTTIVITDWKLVKELLDKKSSLYSFRPPSTVADLITGGHHILMMQYGKTWQNIRKLVHQFFMESRCEKEHFEVQEAEASQMLYDFLTDPGRHMLHPKRFSNSITMSLVYGIRTKSVDDEYMTRLYHLMEKWSIVLETGATPPVDSWTLLQWIPERFMGYWRKRAIEVGDLMTGLYTDALHRVEDRRAKGVRMQSLMDLVLDKQDKNQFSEHQLAFLGGTLMEGGSDTSSSLILAFLQAMTEYPEVQKKAHAEIDAVIGTDRSPQWSDFSKLPYINMIVKEAHRWRPVLPLGVVHGLPQDDEINGMRIPANSTILMNVWGLHNDPQKFPSPSEFIPERYSAHTKLAPYYAASADWQERDHIGYGASRRICPGIHLAERNLFIAVAKLLWAFEFHKKGVNDASAETGTSQGFMQCVKDYNAEIIVRGEERRRTLLREHEKAKAVFDRFE